MVLNNVKLYSGYIPVIGLEVHCQLLTDSKLFCGCSTTFGQSPNTNTCEVCLGMPGSLPVLNKKAVDFAIKLALALGCEIRNQSVFARKQYFYPDLPKGYQITQYDLPYCTGGGIKLEDGKFIELTRIHLEEDAGKSIHGDEWSYVDLNRAGTPLLEIVTEPCIRSATEASAYLRKLRGIVRHLEISDGNLEEGSFRCDVNISLMRPEAKVFGTRCEIKNLNSFRNIEKAIEYEIARQIDVLEENGKVVQQTLLYDPALVKTIPMRSKEEAQDYRYFPDPDLGMLEISEDRVESIRAQLPELPDIIAQRFKDSYGLGDYDANFIASDRDLVRFYEQLIHNVDGLVSEKIAANWLITEFMRQANEGQWDISAPKISADEFADLLKLIGKNTISGKIAKKVLEEMATVGGSASEIVEKNGWTQIVDTGAVVNAINEVLDGNQSQVDEFLSGKQKIYGFFVGQIMRVSKGRFNPDLVNQLLKEELEKRKNG